MMKASTAPPRSAGGLRADGLRPVLGLVTIYLLFSALLRVVLLVRFGEIVLLRWPFVLLAGVVDDLVVSFVLFAPISVGLAVLPRRLTGTVGRIARGLGWLARFGAVFGLVYLGVVEYFFFDEFTSRFNLVAVDYLLFPHEVLINIWESYPVAWALAACGVVTGVVMGIWGKRSEPRPSAELPWRRRALIALVHVLLAAAALTLWSTRTLALFESRIVNEIAINGVSSFVQALRTNEIDYDTYYRTEDRRVAFETLTHALDPSGELLLAAAEGRLDRRFPAGRAVDPASEEGSGTDPGFESTADVGETVAGPDSPATVRRPNVVFLVEESLGAEFSGAYGAAETLTPVVDALCEESLMFENAFATGTRTVRGLEAIVASFPPIPSVSILRRPGNEGIATWGGVMEHLGYETSFIYGGFSLFDNMKYFFENNGFSVHDRTEIEEPVFANIWGVSDQDLFRHSIELFDEWAEGDAPFFSLVLSTSNHKPFTFPPGVGVPESGGGRSAGVRYADYAIGRFFDEARTRPWFDNTIFVIAGDHGARVYGAARVPLYSYEIPVLIYAPKLIEPRNVATPLSQIDIAPTVLGLIGLEYAAPFFGQDLLALDVPADERTLLFNHNHDVALLRGRDMVILGPHKTVSGFRYDPESREITEEEPLPDLVDLATAYYQTAYDQFNQRTYRLRNLEDFGLPSSEVPPSSPHPPEVASLGVRAGRPSPPLAREMPASATAAPIRARSEGGC